MPGIGSARRVRVIEEETLLLSVFIDYFVSTIEQRQTIYGLLGTELILLLVFLLLLITKK